MKQNIKGAILIISCHKHIETRLKSIKFPFSDYYGWKIFYILGNPLQEEDYLIEGETITIKCEDSYIHVGKKVVMGIKYILNNYILEEGILRCGDDLLFNETSLSNFLKKPGKLDYMGVVANKHISTIQVENNNFMPSYYLTHQEDLKNPMHNIPYTMDEIKTFNKIPKCKYAGGVVVYLSNKSCNILVSHFENVGWNVFHYDEVYGYPYIIEDVAVGYILYINGIYVYEWPLYINNLREFIVKKRIPVALHTNKYK